MSFIDDLAANRKKFLDGVSANKGAINLDIIEDFYPDEAHFIYELLQNAEDAGATEADFELTANKCSFIHNGTRHFNEMDIDAITGINSSSKKDNPDKIGKFGVGFKSVFAYTDTPSIWSKNYSFRILQRFLPESIPMRADLGERTRFEFPFNNAKKDSKQAYFEVKAGLEDLSENTLLFLSNLQCITWKIGAQQGSILRVQHGDVHVEVLKEAANSTVASSHWLRFTAPVDGLESQSIAVAYELAFLGEQKAFDSKKPIANQLKVVPAERGCVAVFFTAEKETSGLRFHLHAPFVPELSRASIKNSPANLPLYEQLARLAADSLHGIKELGLLTGEFLAVLPNNDEAIPERYQKIREELIREMGEQPLTPTHAKGYAPAKTLLHARAALKELLSDDDLKFLLASENNPTWAIGATQRNSNLDRFLSSLSIKSWDVDELITLFGQKAYEGPNEWSVNLEPDFIDWLSTKSDEWYQQLYALLYRYLEDDGDFSDFEDVKIVRLANGNISAGNECYFPDERADKSDPFPRVASSILTTGTRKAQQADARQFLEMIGVSEVGETEQVSLILKKRYLHESEIPNEEIYLNDLKRFIEYLDRNPHASSMFREAILFKLAINKTEQTSEISGWGKAANVYLDSPFKDTGLRYYHEQLGPDSRKKWALSDWYSTCGIELAKLTAFAEAVGCSSTFSEFIVKSTCRDNPNRGYLYQVPGERYTTPINNDFTTSKAVITLLKNRKVEFSRLVWRTLCELRPLYLKATYQKNEKGGSRSCNSQLVLLLRDLEWIPLKDGSFVKPQNAQRENLLSGFTFDAGFKWLELVQFGEDEKKRSEVNIAKAQKQAELGFESDEELERAKAFIKLPLNEQERILAEHSKHSEKSSEDFPERPVRNSDVRRQRVRSQAQETPDKESRTSQRTVSVDYEAAKAAAKLYLQEQYTNDNGVMFCQVCKAPQPIILPTGFYYFECVELDNELTKRFRETFLALCPNHAAMYRYANSQKDNMQELLEDANGTEVVVTLAGESKTIQFTETHINDMKACLMSSDLEDID